MNFSIIILSLFSTLSVTPFKFDFGQQGNTQNWYTINDGVMGGRSQGNITYSNSSMIFSGKTSLENNGGFSSVRSRVKNYRLGQYTGIRMRAKSTTGRKFSFQLETNSPWYMPSYKYDFKTKKNEWATIEMPLKDFYETRIGRPTGGNISKETLKELVRLGIILFDKKAGEFNLEVDYIELY